MMLFETILKKPEVILLDNGKYRDDALKSIFTEPRLQGYTCSLTDGIIKEILKDIDIKIHYLITFNNRDFHAVCIKRNIKLIEGS